jgi:precorrin-2 dehydrogenase/sirohydrochlorin ferrochelatase
MSYYPVFLDLRGRKCIVVGGGRVAERKINSLLEAGAEITVISPRLTGGLRVKARKGLIKHLKRRYSKGDLLGAFLAISATGSRKDNVQVRAEADNLNIPVNIVDNPSLCSFIVSSVVVRGPLVIAISTSGVSPALSRSIRKELEKTFGANFAVYLEKLKAVREGVFRKNLPPGKRREFLKEAGSTRILRKLFNNQKLSIKAF